MFENFYLDDILTNADQIKEDLRSLLISLDQDHSPFQIDVYLYIDSDNAGSLDTFTNIGGNSWKDDDHFVLTSVNYQFDNKLDSFELDDMIEALGKSSDEIRSEASSYYGCDVDDSEILSYIESIPEYVGKLVAVYDELCNDFEYNEDLILERFCDEYLRKIMYIYEMDLDRNIFDDINELALSSDEFNLDQLCSVACFLNNYDHFSYEAERYDNEVSVQKIEFIKDHHIVKVLNIEV